jgi:hypothetical protein
MIKRLLLCACMVAANAGVSHAAASGSASVYFYAVPDDDDYLQPTVRADADRLHLEARYNYEGKETVSFWGGYMFRREGNVEMALTPMLGLIAGKTSGFAPGGELWMGWKSVEFYSEGEYVHDTDNSEDSFFYSWSELTIGMPMQWRIGGALQRTQTHDQPREFQGGVLVGTTLARVQVTAHVFDLDLDDKTWVLSAALEF